MKMNFLKLTAATFCLTVILWSCKKDDPAPTVYPVEDVSTGYINATGFNGPVVNEINVSSSEFGLEFKPTVKGRITSLSCKLPDVRTDLRATIWRKFPSPTVIGTYTFNIAAANTNYEFDIPDVDLVKDSTYFISMNSNDYYERSKVGSGNTNYPVTVGNIIFNAYKYENGESQTYPTETVLDYYGGDLFFKFQKVD